GFNQLAVSETNPNLMYVTTGAGLYRSMNGGASWNFVSMPLRQNELAPTSVAIAPSSDNVVYVGAGSNIYKTLNGGSDWVITDTGTKNIINALLVSRDLPQVAYAGVYLK
nr:hypothetical protein [bacterium]